LASAVIYALAAEDVLMAKAATAANRSLDWLNFLLADVTGGTGPFLAIYLMSSQRWSAGLIGIVLTAGGVATVLARGPAGALVDAITWKRTLVAISALLVGSAAAVMAIFPYFWPTTIAQGAAGLADAVFPPAIAAISLGIFGRVMFSRRVGRNEAFNHLGNATAAIVTGLAGYLIAPVAVLWVVVVLALFSVAAAYGIDGTAIDHRLARGADDGRCDPPKRLTLLVESRPLLLFTAAITLFHFANAAMLPLLGEELSQGHQQTSSLFMAACIITAQIVMVPMALLVGHKADAWGRKPLFLAGFAVLPIRGLLYIVTDNPSVLVSIQVLDGIGAGIFGALFFLVIADLTRGFGRYNLALGASGACWGLGAALSNGVAGLVVDAAGYSTAFIFLACCAIIALLTFWLGVPETRTPQGSPTSGSEKLLAPVTSD
jgi:MFS family permease